MDAPMPGGLIFYSQMNSKSRFFVPSVENFFAGVRVEKVMCGSRCNSILLPITVSLFELKRMFPSKFENKTNPYWWTISEKSKGVVGESYVLVIDTDPSESCFEVQLMNDVIKSPFHISKLRFQLCGDDIREIQNSSALTNCFSEYAIKKIVFNQMAHSSPRKEYALIGHDILKLFSCIRHGKISMYVDVKTFRLPENWGDVFKLTSSLKAAGKAPISFKDWEDDSETFEDEDTRELDDDDYYDESC